jgi:hypothetical protein
MADLDPELLREVQKLTRLLNGLSASTEDLEKGMKAFKKATKDGAKMIPGALGGLAIDIAKGDTSFKSLNKVIDVASDAMGGMAKTLPYAGEAINATIKATAEAAKFMLGQMDASAKAFNDLGKVGGLTASGMSGLQKQFTQSGLQLGTFTKLVGDNAMALARFKGTTGEGAETFSEAVGQLTIGSDDSLRRLGMSGDQIGATVGAFVTQQTRLGRSQNMDAKQLADGAKQYAIELDKLQRVTGYSREELQKQQDASLSESRFRSNIDELYAQGKEKEAKALQDMDSRMSKLGPALGQGVRDLTSGSANTDAARRLVASTNGAATGIMARLKSGEITADQANDEMLDALEANKDAMLQTAKFTNGVSDSFVAWNQVSDALNSRRKGASATADKEQAALLAGTDDLTKSTTSAQKNMEKMSIGLQKLGFKGLPYAAKAVDTVTESMDNLVETINKSLGIKGKSKDEIKKEREEKSQAAEKEAEKKSEEEQKKAAPGAPSTQQQRQLDMYGGGPPAPGQSKPTSQEDLAGMGLKIKKGDVQAKDGQLSPQIIEMAKQIQGGIPGFSYFSGFNDLYHRGKDDPSKHKEGLAVDFALASPPSVEQGQQIAAMLKSMGASYVKDEYNGSSKNKVGGHMHAEVSAADGALLSGPQQGYQPNLTMHGTEAIVPIDTPAVSGGGAPSGSTSNAEMMTMQLKKLEELAGIFKNQLYVDEKLLKYSS